MGKELVISSNRHETKVAVLEDDQLVEIYFQRSNEYSLAGSIHKGRVTRVLPGMQSAFVDIGLDRDAFLYVTDFFEEHEEYDRMAAPPEERSHRAEKSSAAPVAPAAAEPQPEEHAPEQENRGERRSRRSRRRRNRGRGLPESKYASAAPAAPAPVADIPADIQVLPGESLAKYQSSPAMEGEDFGLEREGVAATSEEIPDIDEISESAAGIEPAGESESTSGLDHEMEQESQDPEAEPSDEPGSVAEAIQEAVEESVAQIREIRAEESPVAMVDVDSEVEPVASTLEESAPAEVLEDELVPAEEPGDPQSPAVELEEGSELVAVAEELAAAEDGSPEIPAGAQANVREPAPHYPHRVSRRLRRKMHGSSASGELRAAHHEHAARGGRPEQKDVKAAAVEKPAPSISDLLREGQEILVQIAKEPLGQKGARITSHIALPGRYVVYMPTVDHLGVSRKVGSDEERLRLRRILHAHRAGISGGFIVRTAGEGRSEEEIAADMMFLYNLWLDTRQKAEKKPAPAMVHHDLDIVQRLLRDQLATDFNDIWVDSEEIYESVLRFVERLQPNLVPRVKLYTRATPIFDAFNITSELEKALRPKVWLKSGGYIVVNQTEALVAIDVNTGKFVGKSNRLEDTIVKTNTEAIREIVRQIRLRDLGGIIVVDFIDMDERKNRQKVMQALEEEMQRDRAPNKILQFNDFGLVAITRKRVKQSLERTLCAPCPYCEGAGYVKSVQTVVSEILQEAVKIAKAVEGPNVVLRVNPEVAKLLKSTDNDYLEELEEVLERPVLVTGDATLHPEKWDLA